MASGHIYIYALWFVPQKQLHAQLEHIRQEPCIFYSFYYVALLMKDDNKFISSLISKFLKARGEFDKSSLFTFKTLT